MRNLGSRAKAAFILLLTYLACALLKVFARSIFLCQRSHDFDINMSRITVVDHIVQELCKKPHSVVFLENVDEADLVVQNSLSHAIQMGNCS